METIARSRSGRTYIQLESELIYVNGSKSPLCTLGNLKWLKGQPNFKALFLNKIPESYFENIESHPFDVTSLPVKACAISFLPVHNIRTWYGNNEGYFSVFSHTGDIVFGTQIMVETGWEFIPKGISIEEYMEIKDQKAKKAQKRHEARMQQLYESNRGWYVVTLDASISRIRGNDGRKTYSFKVLANNKMDAFEKARDIVMTPGRLNDNSVSFVYDCERAEDALIEYIGTWTDDAELEYGPEKQSND